MYLVFLLSTEGGEGERESGGGKHESSAGKQEFGRGMEILAEGGRRKEGGRQELCAKRRIDIAQGAPQRALCGACGGR